MKNIKKLSSFVIAAIFILFQFLNIPINNVHANSVFNVNVVIEGTKGIIAAGTSDKSNAFDALNDVLKQKNIPIDSSNKYGGAYISSISGIKSGSFGGYDGWMYTVREGNNYKNITTSIDQCTLENGNNLILYYGDFNTLTLNKLTMSTSIPNTKLTLTLNNTYDDWNTGKPVITPISGITAKVYNSNGEEMTSSISANTIVFENGLPGGSYTLKVSDYNNIGIPKVVNDELTFQIKQPQCNVKIEGISGTIFQGNGTGNNVLDIFKNAVGNAITYHITPSEMGDYLDTIDNIKSGDITKYAGWNYIVKSGSQIISPSVGISSYVPNDNDEIIFYYSDSNVPYVNKITFNPSVIVPNQGFTARLTYTYKDFSNWPNYTVVEKPIKDTVVTINSKTYKTNYNGDIAVTDGLPKGDYIIKVSGYSDNELNKVVSDSFKLSVDGNTSSNINMVESDVASVTPTDNSKIVKDINSEIQNTLNVVKTYDTPWAAVSLQKLNVKPSEDFISNAAKDITKYGITDYSNTDLEKLSFGLIASGYSPYNFNGIDLISTLLNRNINDFLINDSIYALMLYNYGNINGNYEVTKEQLKNKILSSEINDNNSFGWSLTKTFDPDITSAAITALSYFYNKDSEVTKAVNDAVVTLANKTTDSGYVPGLYGPSCETNAFVIMALTSIGISPEKMTVLNDNQVVNFSKSNGDLVSALLSFKNNNGSYKHELTGSSDPIATEEALRALISIKQFNNLGIYNYYSSNINSSSLNKYSMSNEIDKTVTVDSNIGTTAQNLPKTGSFLSEMDLIYLGILFIISGTSLLIFLYKKNNRRVDNE
ncbi:MAG: hypothetical protein K0R54_3260 [Clostridiaceae bacterium]|jgi:hypothetical protein|nr:hypothetical protein [Clostridiaceae bacterium]